MNANFEQCAVLFADISGSTALYDRLGNTLAKRLLDEAVGRMRVACEKHAGKVIKTIGDEVMAVFPAASHAAEAALAIQFALRVPPATALAETLNAGLSNSPVGMKARIGFHWGDVIHDANDVFGDAVNVAARLTDLARGGQILLSSVTIEQLSTFLKNRTQIIDVAQFKGKTQEFHIFSLQWEEEEAVTRVATSPVQAAIKDSLAGAKLVHLTIGQQRLTLIPEQMPINLGRDGSCQLVVNAPLASRIHAKMEYRRGKFVLTDNSTNGTFVTNDEGREVFLKRESMPLLKNGTVSLGCALMQQTGDIVKFVCE
jgi:class 3 adenylate cyclase